MSTYITKYDLNQLKNKIRTRPNRKMSSRVWLWQNAFGWVSECKLPFHFTMKQLQFFICVKVNYHSTWSLIEIKGKLCQSGKLKEDYYRVSIKYMRYFRKCPLDGWIYTKDGKSGNCLIFVIGGLLRNVSNYAIGRNRRNC